MASQHSVARAAPRIRRGSIALFLALGLALQIGAQPAPAQEAAPASPVSRADAERLIRALEDDRARAKLIEELRGGRPERTRMEAGTAPAPAAKPAGPAASAAGETALDRPASRFLLALGDSVRAAGLALASTIRSAGDLPRLYGWIENRLKDAESRKQAAIGLAHLAGIVGTAALLQSGVSLLRGRWRRRHEARAFGSPWRRAGFAAVGAAVNLMPTATFWIVTMIMVAALQPDRVATLLAVAAANAQALAGLCLAIPRALLAPSARGLRVAPVDDAAAGGLYRAIRAVLLVAVYAYFLAAAALAVGLPVWTFTTFTRLAGVLTAGLLAAMLLRSRVELDRLARLLPPAENVAVHRQGWFWQALLLAYLAVALSVWLAQGGEGVVFLARATALSLAALSLAAVATIAMRRARAAALRRLGGFDAASGGFDARVHAYVRALNAGAAAAVFAGAGVAVAEAWGLPVLRWLGQAGGTRLASSLVSIALVAGIGVAIWEAINLLAERLIRVDEGTIEGMRRAARRRTVLPLVRRVSLGVLATLIGMVALSEIGINVAPLIAGAGIVGIAVGFGAQQIVKDLFGGVSVLMEDSIAVGDIVNVAGKGGVVEWMSLRALRLRDFDGAVHIVPFGEVTTITNLTKHFAYAVLKIGVSYDSDVEQVQRAIRDTAARMRKDPDYARMILDDVELHGVDSFGDNAVVVLARVKVAPARQWTVMRQFHVLLKQEFERQGIEIPFPQRTITFARGARTEAAEAPAPERRMRTAGAGR